MIKYTCSNGEKVSQATIDKRLSDSYKTQIDNNWYCRGCGHRSQCHAHIVSQSRCKQLHKTELIWNPKNYVPSCYGCNSKIENISSQDFKDLDCYRYCLKILKEFDEERFLKATLS